MKKYLGLLLTGVLMSCSQSDSGSGNSNVNSEGIPETLPAHEVIQRPHLTASQKQEVTNTMAQARVVPSPQLSLPKENESTEDRQKREEKISKLSAESKEILEAVQKNCVFALPKTEKQESNMDQAGGTSHSETNSGISGSNCPIAFSETQTTDLNVVATNFAEIQKQYEQTQNPDVFQQSAATYKLSGKMTSDLKIVDSALANQSGIQQMTNDVTVTGTMVIAGMKLKNYYKAQGSATILPISGAAIVAQVEMETLQLEQSEESYSKFDFQFPSTSAVLQIFKSASGTRFFVNGESMTEAQVKTLFGETFVPDSQARALWLKTGK